MNKLNRSVVLFAAGDLLGLAAVALLSVALLPAAGSPLDIPGLLLLLSLASGLGLVQGVIQGGFQWLALRRVLRSLSWRQWIVATSVGPVAAWLILVSANFLWRGPGGNPSPVAVVGVFAAFGAVLGTVVGLPQWVLLRRYSERAVIWLIASIVAWVLATFALVFALGFAIALGEEQELCFIQSVTILLLGFASAAIFMGVARSVGLRYLPLRPQSAA